jgi:hypothetical protein
MAKTSLKVKAARKPKFKVRGYTRYQRCGRPHAVYQKFGHMLANFQVSQKQAGKPTYEKGPYAVGKPVRERPQATYDNDRSDRRHAYTSA